MDELKLYVIVEFTETGEITTTVRSWLKNKNRCLWPEKYSRKLLINCEPPNKEWEMWNIRILGSSDDLKEALAKERKAQRRSDKKIELATRAEKRKRLKFSQVISESDESSDEYVTPDYVFSVSVKANNKNECNGHVNKRSKSIDISCSKSVNPESGTKKTLEAILSDTPESDQLRTLEDMISRSSEIDQLNSLEEATPLIHGSESLPITRTKNSDKSGCHDDCLKQLKGQIKNVEMAVLKIKSDVEELLIFLGNQTKKNIVLNPDAETEFEKHLPLTTVEDLMELDNSLKNEETRNEVIGYLQQVGGASVEDMTKRIIVKLFSNDLASKYNWEGKKGKRELKSLQLIKLVQCIISQGPYKYTSDVFEKKVKDWFKHASTRRMSEIKLKSLSENENCYILKTE